jgi:hypothetical protein
VAGLQTTVASQPVLFSRQREIPNGVFASGGKIYYRVRHLERVLFETRDVTLRGDFNLEDVLAATTAACLLGADFAAIRKAVREFQAVEHRLEFVQEIEGVDFYNNSKATSVDATLKSLEAFQHGVHLIMGGKDKGAPYTPLLPLIKDRVRDILLIGVATPVIAQQLEGPVEMVEAGDLATAIHEAFARARPGDTVLLAPACSSFDQFHDYEERGRVFKALVKQLAEDVAVGRVLRRPKSDGQVPEIAGRGFESAVRNPESPSLTVESVISRPESAVRNLESGISNLESENSKSEDHESQTASSPPEPPPDAVVNTEEPSDAVTPLLSKEGCPEGGVVDLAPAGEATESLERPASGRRHLELRYVYEVRAEEMPAMESQTVSDDEPEVYVTAGAAEIVEDEILPFEMRPAARRGSKVRSPKPQAQGAGPGAAPTSKQPRLFNGDDPNH